MKIGSTVFAMHVAVLCVFALTQGCVTTESQGSGLGAGAKHKGPFRHDHKGNGASGAEGTAVAIDDPYGAYQDDGSSVFEEAMIIESSSNPEPNPNASSYGQTEIYIVQKGDILSQLAVDFDTTTAMLVELNGLSNPDILYVGQELSVPAGHGVSKTTSKSTGSIKKGGSYTIQKGDTLSGIAVAAGVTIDDLRELNGMKSDMIMADEEIDIPSYGKVPSNGRSNNNSTAPTTRIADPVVEPEMAAPPPTEPVFDTSTTSVEPPMDVAMVIDDVMYPGETLEDKARQYGVSKADILRASGLTSESQIKERMTIRIPVPE